MIAWWLDRMRWMHLILGEWHEKRAKHHRVVATLHAKKARSFSDRLLAMLDRRMAGK